MNTETTRCIIEISDHNEVNEYLKLGWLLINHYVHDVGEFGQPSQRIFYVLAWQKVAEQPLHPHGSRFLQNKRNLEAILSTQKN